MGNLSDILRLRVIRRPKTISTIHDVTQSVGRCIDYLHNSVPDPERYVLRAIGMFLLRREVATSQHHAIQSMLRNIDIPPLEREAQSHGYPDSFSAVMECWLSHYKKSDRNWHGAFYTPDPLAGFLVRSTDTLLQEMGYTGFSDTRLTTIDPACGTGHLLCSALECGLKHEPAYGTFYGMDILSAAADVCDLRMHSLAGKYGAHCGSCIRCETGDALTAFPDTPVSPPVAVLCAAPFNQYATCALQPESSAAVLHSSYAAACDFSGLDAYAHTDAYIKFTALCHDLVVRSSSGVAALILRNNWLSSHAHAEMRKAILQDFDGVYILDLHGDPHDRFHTESGRNDENVYAGMVYDVGVCVCFLVRGAGKGTTIIQKADLTGSRSMKWDWLLQHSLGSVAWRMVTPKNPWCAFV